MKRRFFSALLRRRWLYLSLALGTIALAVVGASRVTVDYDVEDFFSLRDPARITYDAYKAFFPKEDAQVSAFYEANGPLEAEDYRALAEIAEIFEGEGLLDVTFLGNADVAEMVGEGSEETLSVHPLVEEREPTTETLRQVLEEHADDPLYLHALWNEEQRVFAVHGTLAPENNDAAHRAEVEARLTERLDALETPAKDLRLSGLPIVRARAVELISSDTGLFVGLGVLLMALVLFLFFGRLSQVAMVMVAILPSYIATLGVMGAAGASISTLGSFIPIIVLVVGVCDTTHILTHLGTHAKVGGDSTEAILDAFEELLMPCFYTSLTTALGFASVAATGIDVITEFGLFTALAIALTFAYSMVLMPILLSFQSAPTGKPPALLSAITPVLSAAKRQAKSRSLVVPGLILALGLGAVGLGMGLRTNAYLVDDVRPDQEIRHTMDKIEGAGFGLFQVAYWLGAAEGEALHAPEALRFMDDLQRFAEEDQSGVVVHSVSVVDHLMQVKRALTGDPDAELPSSRQEAAQLLLLAQMGTRDFVRDFYIEEEGTAQVSIVVRDEGSAKTVPFLQRLESFVEEHPYEGGEATATGSVVMAQRVYADVVGTFGSSLAIAAAAIFLVMTFMFRSPLQGLIAMVPNVVPLFFLVGVLAIGGWDLKPSTLLVFSIAFGIAVDDTIHLLGRVRSGLHGGRSVDDAIADAIDVSGKAIVMTSVVIGVGFSVLLLSSFEILFLVGLMSLVSVVVAVVADLFLYPTLLRLTLRPQLKKRLEAPSSSAA